MSILIIFNYGQWVISDLAKQLISQLPGTDPNQRFYTIPKVPEVGLK